ncbi:glycoside hydrolase family 6 protein [Botryobasidium botryosum FD-172 SS1]|uniref:Glucanase n=1 Tax=Botryobasidium botryosum (strain FD-172 SS1) TaxID=930990 RepID=A0A067M463_BOTB1|nr:glycoside hydrolase family 6 protein [Botryobasidium botryosum FD-172 SS1]
MCALESKKLLTCGLVPMKSIGLLSLGIVLSSFANHVNAVIPTWGQCQGIGYSGSTACATGNTCTRMNDYYFQCLPGSQSSTTTSSSTRTSSKPQSATSGTTSTTSARSSPVQTSKTTATTQTTAFKAPPGSSTSPTASTPTPPAGGSTTTISASGPAPTDNPYTGYSVYLSPYYAAEVAAAAKTMNSTWASKAASIAQVPTFTWYDVSTKVPSLGNDLANASSIQKSTGKKQIVQIVVYDLPDRDCAAKASNGEFSIANGGAAKYQAYIDAIASQITAHPDVRVVAIIEPDSLGNLVTNMGNPVCANAAPTYKSLIAYAIQKLSQPNIYLYLDAGHAGWLGWPANLSPAAQLFAQILTMAGGTFRVRGLATNVSNYNALRTSTPDPITQENPNYDEELYINALAPLLQQNTFPAQFIVDQGRSGVQNIRDKWGDWCNIRGAGFGTRPTTSTGNALIDAIVWVKPGGESDGTSNSTSSRYDPTCSLTDATQPAPEAGTWFQAYFQTLVIQANPPL